VDCIVRRGGRVHGAWCSTTLRRRDERQPWKSGTFYCESFNLDTLITFRQVNFSTVRCSWRVFTTHPWSKPPRSPTSRHTQRALRPSPSHPPFKRPFTAWPPRWKSGAKNHRFEFKIFKDLIQDRGRNGINRGVLRPDSSLGTRNAFAIAISGGAAHGLSKSGRSFCNALYGPM
jgi:hypothetical protein